MAAQVCCVDHERPGTMAIGGRWFCDDHYAKATHKRPSFWRTSLVAVIGLLVFVAAVVALDTYLKPQLNGIPLLVAGVLLALVPAVLWLVFFYQQDRLEPEPVGQVVRIFVVGLALAGAIGVPLIEQLFHVQDWLYAGSDMTTFLASIFVIGAVEAFIIYATVRYFIFDLPEFDERTDGVIYGTAAGLGYATALNLGFILSNGGSALGSGEVWVAEVALAHAAIGGLLGYFLGRAKLEQDPIWWLPTGVVLAALLNGLFIIARGELDLSTVTFTSAGAGLPSFNGLLVAGGMAVVITALVSYLINRDIARSLSGKQPAVTVDPIVGDRQANLATWATFIVLLLIGTVTWYMATGRSQVVQVAGLQGSYPAQFTVATGEGELLRLTDSLGTSAEFVVTTPILEGAATVAAVASQLAAERSTTYDMYKVLSSDTVVINGRTALSQAFAYVDSNGLTGAAPEVHQGLDYIFVENGTPYVVTMLTTPDEQADVEPLFARFLNSLSFGS